MLEKYRLWLLVLATMMLMSGTSIAAKFPAVNFIKKPTSSTVGRHKADLFEEHFLLTNRGNFSPKSISPVYLTALTGNQKKLDILKKSMNRRGYAKTGHNPLDAVTGYFKHTALAYLINDKHYEAADFLLQNGANINYVHNGMSVLEFILSHPEDTHEKAEYLIEQGVNLNIDMAFNNDRPLTYVLSHRKNLLDQEGRLFRSLLSQYEENTDLDINHVRSDNSTALTLVITNGSLSQVKLLLDYGADVNLGQGKNSPLYKSIYSGNLEAAYLLVKRGADTSYITQDKVIKYLTTRSLIGSYKLTYRSYRAFMQWLEERKATLLTPPS